jgi:hypothetical protein
MASPRLQLDARAVSWRLALIVFVVRQVAVLAWVRGIPASPGKQLAIFLFGRFATQRSLILAFLIAGAVTLVLDFLVLLVLRPLVRHWHRPTSEEASGLFRLDANEWIVESTPARWRSGWLWPTGLLARSNRRLWFFPDGWDREPWSCPLEEVADARLIAAPAVAWGFVKHWPDRLAVRGDGEPAAEVFAVPDPEAVVAWFHPPVGIEETDDLPLELTNPARSV